MKIDDVIHGFRLLRSEQIAEAEGTAHTFVHEKTGAQTTTRYFRSASARRRSMIREWRISWSTPCSAARVSIR